MSEPAERFYLFVAWSGYDDGGAELELLTAQTLDEARVEATAKAGATNCLESATLVRASLVEPLDVETIRAEARRRKEEAAAAIKAAAQAARDRAEYERLRPMFEGKS